MSDRESGSISGNDSGKYIFISRYTVNERVFVFDMLHIRVLLHTKVHLKLIGNPVCLDNEASMCGVVLGS